MRGSTIPSIFASAWSSQQAGRFTINLGVSTRARYEGFPGRKFPTDRGTAVWPINVRLGFLMPDRTDRWWQVTANDDSNLVGAEVVAALRDYGLPFFERLLTLEQLAHWVREAFAESRVIPAQRPLILAILAVEKGDAAEASSLLRAAIAESRGEPFESTVRRVAATLGVSR